MKTDRWTDKRQDSEEETLRMAADLLARIMDTAIPIPGTSLRIGLDPVLGLLPGIGDSLASLIGSAILLLAARLRVPKIVLVRMSVNLLLNGAVGTIPVAGDLFSVWFQSNARNAALLRRASAAPRPRTWWDWTFVIGVLAGTLALIAGVTLALFWVIARLWQLVQ